MPKSLLKSTGLVSAMTFLSRILGFVRDVVIAQVFGATANNDAFLVAFKIPNFLRSLFAEGAFSQAFVPLLSEQQTLEERGEASTRDFVARVSGCLALVCAIVTIAGMLAAPFLINVFAPGFDGGAGRHQLASDLLRITFPYLFFIALTALSGGVLNTYGRYGPPAFTPVLLNVSMITAALFLAPHCAVPITALAWGVFFGGVVQLAFQLPFLHRVGMLRLPRMAFSDPAVRKLLTLMLPALVGVSIVQINLLITTVFASMLPVGSISWLYFADRLMQFPLGVFGVAIATVVLPHLSRGFANGDETQYQSTLGWALLVAFVLTLPAAVGLYMLATPLVSSLFQHGNYTALDAMKSAAALKAYAVGIMAFILIKVLAAAFYARQNIKTPVKLAGVSLVVNIILSGSLSHYFGHVGLALALSLSSLLHVTILTILLWRQRRLGANRQAVFHGARILGAILLMAAFLAWFTPEDSYWLEGVFREKITAVLGLVASGALVYLLALALFGLRLKHLRNFGSSI